MQPDTHVAYCKPTTDCAFVRSWRFCRPEVITLTDTVATVQVWAYRLGGFALLNLMDDPAWLALMFC
jgi:hypothetical protein